jgi:hypothetical protein
MKNKERKIGHHHLMTSLFLFLFQVRENELDVLKSASYLGAVANFSWTCAPFLVSLVTFICYTTIGNELTPQKAFVALSLFNLLRFPLAMLPFMITSIIEADVSRKRITNFLNLAEASKQKWKKEMEKPKKRMWACFGRCKKKARPKERMKSAKN